MMSTSNWMSEFWQTLSQLSTAVKRLLNFVYRNWKHSIAGTAASAALVGEAYIIIQTHEEGKAVRVEISGDGKGHGHHSYFFWLAMGIVVACANNLVIACLATFKNAYWKTNRDKKTKWMWPLFAAYVCVMGLMAGILPASMRPHDGPPVFAVVSILSIYFQSILWAIILGWRDVEKAYNGSNSTAPGPPPPPTILTAQSPNVTTPQPPPAKFLPLL